MFSTNFSRRGNLARSDLSSFVERSKWWKTAKSQARGTSSIKNLPPHCGPWSGRLRAHLGLIIPDTDNCFIRVADQTYHWKNGEVVYFDDTYKHEAFNNTDKLRVVLFMDILRPMKFPYNLINRFLLFISRFLPFAKIPLKRHREWEKVFHKGL